MVFLSKEYRWGPGVKYAVPAAVVGGVLEHIEERDGQVSKEAFLEESRPEEAETHDLFEWDDAKAAEKYRLVQSGKIINNLVIEVKTVGNPDKPILTKAVVNVEPENHKTATYKSIEVAMTDTSSREIVLHHALVELASFKAKYSSLTELAGVIDEITKVEEQIA